MRLCSNKKLVFFLSSIFFAQGCAALPETAAVQQLRVDYEALQQLKADFDQSQKAGKLSAREAADFQTWIRQLQDQVAENCLLEADNGLPLPVNPPCEKILAGYSVRANIDIKGESTEAERTKRMIEQLNGSLGEFDERLLTEQERVKSRAPRTDSAGGGSSGSGREENEAAEGEKGEKEQAGKETGKERGKNRQTSSRETGTPTQSPSSKKSTAPKDIPDGRNDDVVARQLREAAEKESDPELKKKLWDEYRRYKSGSLK